MQDELTAAQASLESQKQQTEAAKKFKQQLKTLYTPVIVDSQSESDTANKSAEELRCQVASLKTELAREQVRHQLCQPHECYNQVMPAFPILCILTACYSAV